MLKNKELSRKETAVAMLLAQSCPTLCDPTNRSLPGFSIHGILQARILEWIAIPFYRGSSWPRDWTQVSYTAGRFFTIWATGKISQEIENHSNKNQWLKMRVTWKRRKVDKPQISTTNSIIFRYCFNWKTRFGCGRITIKRLLITINRLQIMWGSQQNLGEVLLCSFTLTQLFTL